MVQLGVVGSGAGRGEGFNCRGQNFLLFLLCFTFFLFSSFITL